MILVFFHGGTVHDVCTSTSTNTTYVVYIAYPNHKWEKSLCSMYDAS
jgi:hypothetical protein